MDQVFQVISDAMIDVTLYFFRDKLAEAYADKQYAKVTTEPVKKKSPNITIYDILPEEFTFEQAQASAIDIKGVNTTSNSVSQMLKNWRNQGLVDYIGNKQYVKILSTCQSVK
jgi:hypothetical protein